MNPVSTLTRRSALAAAALRAAPGAEAGKKPPLAFATATATVAGLAVGGSNPNIFVGAGVAYQRRGDFGGQVVGRTF